MIRIAPLAAALAVTACGAASEPSPKEAAAERAYSAGRYLEAAERFSEAAQASPRARDREEARYRQAMSLHRAGRPEEARAVLETLQKTFPQGARAPRAAYDAALIDIAGGRESDGYSALDALVRRYPESGPASAALRRYVEWLSKTGEDGVRAYLEELRPRVAATGLVQYVDYEHARSLDRGGAASAALAEYLAVADRYPYPRGVFWDDSLFRAAELEAARGAPREAIAHFERLLADREPAIMQGSYERPRYAEAQFRIGELYRDALHDRPHAREAFERMWATNTTSRLRDDAMWSAAVLAVESGDAEGACRDLRALVEETPDSRYVPCAPTLCPALRAARATRPCHEYLLLGRDGP